MDTTQTGTLAEMQAALAYMKDGWEVFLQSNGKAPFDLVAYKDETLRRVTVKGTSQESKQGGFIVDLRSIRPNRTGNTIKHLSEYDELFVWVFPWEEGFFFFPEAVNGRDTISFHPDRRAEVARHYPGITSAK